jgi:hypothetical protein
MHNSTAKYALFHEIIINRRSMLPLIKCVARSLGKGHGQWLSIVLVAFLFTSSFLTGHALGIQEHTFNSEAASISDDSAKVVDTTLGDLRSRKDGIVVVHPNADTVCVSVKAGRGERTACTRSDSREPAILVTGTTPDAEAHIVVIDPSTRAKLMKLLVNGEWKRAFIREDGLIVANVSSTPQQIDVLDKDEQVLRSDKSKDRAKQMEDSAKHSRQDHNH